MTEISITELKEDVLSAIKSDPLAAELQLALFSAALLSYRKDTCLRPFPDFLQKENTKDIETLEQLFDVIPSLEDLKGGRNILSEHVWKLLHWILRNKIFSASTCQKNELKNLQEKTGQSSFALEPDYIFEVSYHTNASKTFDEHSKQHGIKYGYHGSRMDNFYSITSSGLQVHMMKNGLFGDGIYLCEDLAVTMPYVSGGTLWKHSNLGAQASCVAVCEILDHPGVKYQAGDKDKKLSRSTAKNSQCGEVPEKYFVVTSSNLIRIKYLLLFMDKKVPRRLAANRRWFFVRYPVGCVLLIYLLFLVTMGLWRSRYLQLYLNKNWKTKLYDDD